MEEPQVEPQVPPESPPLSSAEGEHISLARAFGGRSLVRELFETGLLILMLALLVNSITVRFQVQGTCMEPTLHDGQYLIVSRLTYWVHPPERGDIIILQPPDDPDQDYVKRIVGLPGERIEIQGGSVWIDGIQLEEPYVVIPPTYTSAWELGEGEYFVLGDNREGANDSHNWGVLLRESIIGKAWLCYWPPEEWGLAPHHTFPDL